MDFRNDDLQIVTQLATGLNEVLQSSNNKTNKIEDLLKKIAKYTDSNTEQLFNQEPDKNFVEDVSKADQLRSENLELMLMIERQDHISKRWEQILQQNENILETIKEWINENPALLTRNVLELEDQLSDLTAKYKNSRNGVLYDVKVSEHKIQLVYGALQSILKELESSDNNKQQFAQKIQELVTIIEKLEAQTSH